MRVFNTARLHIRPLGDGDELLYCRLYTDPLVMQHIGPALSFDAAQRNFRTELRHQGGKRLLWVIIDRAAGAECGVLGVVRESTAAEVGVMLFAERQARGIAVEVLSAVIAELFGNLSVQRLWTRHATANAPAAALMRNLGFERTVDDNAPVGQQRWQVTRECWIPRESPMAAS